MALIKKTTRLSRITACFHQYLSLLITPCSISLLPLSLILSASSPIPLSLPLSQLTLAPSLSTALPGGGALPFAKSGRRGGCGGPATQRWQRHLPSNKFDERGGSGSGALPSVRFGGRGGGGSALPSFHIACVVYVYVFVFLLFLYFLGLNVVKSAMKYGWGDGD